MRISHPIQSGGKAGKGCNRTSTVRVMEGDLIKKQFRYTTFNVASYAKALEKAKKYIEKFQPSTQL